MQFILLTKGVKIVMIKSAKKENVIKKEETNETFVR